MMRKGQEISWASDLHNAVGMLNVPREIPLQLQSVKARYSEEEIEYFVAAALESKIGRPHLRVQTLRCVIDAPSPTRS